MYRAVYYDEPIGIPKSRKFQSKFIIMFWTPVRTRRRKMFENSSLALLRSLSRELRYFTSNGKLLDRPLVRWILSEYRSNQVTPAQYCRGSGEMAWVADTYLQYVRAQRICLELTEKHQKREKTVQETADMIGFKLPPSTPEDKHTEWTKF